MESRSSSGVSLAGVEAAWSELRAIVGEEHMRLAAPEDSVDGVQPQMVIEPGSADEIARVLKTATSAGLQVLPRGGATKMDWGNPPRGADLIISTRRLNRIVEHAWGDMTATVEAGCTLQQLQRTLDEHGQRLALDPLWPDRATIGGILATNDSGPLRIRFGSLRDLIIGVTLVLSDGTLAKSGGKVVKNVAGYDLPKLATGSLGTLGIIAQAIFRLHPIPRESRTLSFSAPDNAAINALVLAILDSKLVPTGVQVRAAGSSLPEVDLRFEGTAAGCDAQVDQVVRLAAGVRQSAGQAEVWNASAALWDGAESSVLCKFTLLPASMGTFFDKVMEVAEQAHLQWRIAAQAVGAGLLRLEADGAAADVFLSAIAELRQGLEARGGSLAVLRCPSEMKAKFDVWGSPGDVLPVMKSVKAQ
ncbi:MAG TPA: FAD-binding oxidoreductase, partial [Bryobacteraceae bacterium]|nr:FAD-binding oxidoreductase [Bryobacteraceae bacterium]